MNQKQLDRSRVTAGDVDFVWQIKRLKALTRLRCWILEFIIFIFKVDKQTAHKYKSCKKVVKLQIREDFNKRTPSCIETHLTILMKG